MNASSRFACGAVCVGVVAASLAARGTAFAQSDPGAAREQLKEGVELRKQGNCAAALPHLVESQRLDPQSRTLINLADCEEQVKKLGDALRDWVRARELAGKEGSEAIRDEAERRLTELEKRMPRLRIRLAPGAPADTVVLRDGLALGAVSLGEPLPTDPGAHVVVVRAGGRVDARVSVDLVEGETKELTVQAGPPEPRAPAPPPSVALGPERSPPTTQRTLGWILGGIGVVGLGVGSGLGLDAISKWSTAQSPAHCNDSTSCDGAGVRLTGQANTSANASTIVFGASAIVVAGSVLLLVTAPRSRAREAAALRLLATPRRGWVLP